MEAVARVTAVIGFVLCACVALAGLWMLVTGKRISRVSAREADPRASMLAAIWLCLCGCIVTGTIATGWTMSHPEVIMLVAVPAWLVTFGLSLRASINARKTRR